MLGQWPNLLSQKTVCIEPSRFLPPPPAPWWTDIVNTQTADLGPVSLCWELRGEEVGHPVLHRFCATPGSHTHVVGSAPHRGTQKTEEMRPEVASMHSPTAGQAGGGVSMGLQIQCARALSIWTCHLAVTAWAQRTAEDPEDGVDVSWTHLHL